MKIAIVGSREFNDYEFIEKTMDQILKRYNWDVSLIISGGARGADKLGAKWSEKHAIPLLTFWADWNKYGKAAGPIRNQQIVNASDLVIAFWDGKSPGTKDCLDKADKAKKESIRIQV